MHQSVLEFAGSAIARYDLADRPVLEVGSLDINGTVRELFDGDYIGIDMRDGQGVDIVMNAHDLNGDFGDREVILCLEMLEHDDAPWLSLQQMRQTAAPNAMLLVTARGYGRDGFYKVHDCCWNDEGSYAVGDFWRFSVDGMRALLEQTGWRVLECAPDTDRERPGVFAIAQAA